MRHLGEGQALSALRRERQIDQMLGRVQLEDGRWAVQWITISPQRSRFQVVKHEVEDVGRERGTYDVSEFPALDDAEAHGEGVVLGLGEGPSEALALASAHGAAVDKWVNVGVLADEYRDSV